MSLHVRVSVVYSSAYEKLVLKTSVPLFMASKSLLYFIHQIFFLVAVAAGQFFKVAVHDDVLFFFFFV